MAVIFICATFLITKVNSNTTAGIDLSISFDRHRPYFYWCEAYHSHVLNDL
jgi:hypothetical protein